MESLIEGFDHNFITYACRWVAEEIAKCENEDELEAVPSTITSKLKTHMSNHSAFLDITHCPESSTEEEKVIAGNRYEDHVNHACALTWALFLRELESELEKFSQEECVKVE
jgi:hypothetical protein